MPPICVTNWESKLKTVIRFKECDDAPGANTQIPNQLSWTIAVSGSLHRTLEAHGHLEEHSRATTLASSKVFPQNFFHKSWCCFSLLRHFSLQMSQTAMPPWKGTWASIIIILYNQYQGVFFLNKVDSIVWTSEAQAGLLTPQQHKVAFRDVVAEKAIRYSHQYVAIT